MEPVFMMLGEAAGVAAGKAITDKVAVQDVEYAALRRELELGDAVLPAGN
jgi:hypothetical protein